VLKDVRTKLSFPFVFPILTRNLVSDVKGITPTDLVREKKLLRAVAGPETGEENGCKRKWQRGTSDV